MYNFLMLSKNDFFFNYFIYITYNCSKMETIIIFIKLFNVSYFFLIMNLKNALKLNCIDPIKSTLYPHIN